MSFRMARHPAVREICAREMEYQIAEPPRIAGIVATRHMVVVHGYAYARMCMTTKREARNEQKSNKNNRKTIFG